MFLCLSGCCPGWNQPQHPPHTAKRELWQASRELALPLPPKNVWEMFKFHPGYSGAAHIFNRMSFLGCDD